MLQRHLFSHGFTPPLFALMVTVLLESVLQMRVNAKGLKCQEQGAVRQGFALKINDTKAKKLLANVNSIRECIELSCKYGGANYAVLENGKCFALYCKKNACQLKRDKNSKQSIVGLIRKGVVNPKENKGHQKKRKLKRTHHNGMSIKSIRKKKESALKRKQKGAITKASNRTLAFSTAVALTNKSNPVLTYDSNSRSGSRRTDVSKKLTKKIRHTTKSVRNLSDYENLRRTTVNSRQANKKLHKKHVRNLSKSKSANNKNVEAIISKGAVNSSIRQTREYPYSYYQYQYSPAEKTYQTQETDWRRDMIPSSLYSPAAYDGTDKQSLYQAPDDATLTGDQASLNGNSIDTHSPSNELFSLPIANLVRRTEIPGNPHHISSISIVNDMASDEQNGGYLTDRDNIESLPANNHLGYSNGNIGQLHDKSDGKTSNYYGLMDHLSYTPQQHSADFVYGGLGQPLEKLDETAGFSSENNIKMTGLPLNSFLPLRPQVAYTSEDQSPTGSPVILDSDLSQNAPARVVGQRHLAKNESDSSMEFDLTDPVHLATSKEALADKMKKFANISMVSNLLPSKESVQKGSHSISRLQKASLHQSANTSSPASGSVTNSVSGASNSDIKRPANSIYSALRDDSGIQSRLSTTPSVTIFPTTSKSIATGISSFVGQDFTNIKQGDIDAPVQNVILPVSNKEEVYRESQSGDGQITTAKDVNGQQSSQNSLGANMDLPFPTRRKLPEPSRSILHALSGLSSAVYVESFSENTTHLPTIAEDVTSSSEAAINMTTKLTSLPTVTAQFDTTATRQTTPYGSLYNSNTNYKDTQETVSFLHHTRPSITSEVLKGWHQDLSPEGYIPESTVSFSSVSAMDKLLPSVSSNETLTSSDSKPVATLFDEVQTLTRGHTYQITSDNTGVSFDDGLINSRNVTPTASGYLGDIFSTAILPYKSGIVLSSQRSGHLSPESRISIDNHPGHISPIANPQLRITGNGSVIVLNHRKKQPNINQIYNQYQRDEEHKTKLKAKKLKLLEIGNGCHTPLGMSNGIIGDDQIIASSYLSPRYAPFKARLGSKEGNTDGWCADPRLNNITQYLQVDFRGIKNVCRVGMQSHRSARNWITHYKIAFSMDGRHWSIYKELSKDKVLQGNIKEDDWTSYRLVYPIRTRFIRILPQAWEGREMCTLVEFYTNDAESKKMLSERSNIPSTMQYMIDDLNFEKVENEIVFDSSPMGNNAFLNKGAAVYDTHGKCRHAARIGEGSDILLDGRNMRVKPREAISISVWVRVDRTEGVHSIFDTVGAKSNHVLGQYHFEIVGGAVRWFHRDENGTQIFSVITEPNFINQREWNHLVVSYDSDTGFAKIYVNGSRVAETTGKGLLSRDWGGRVGLGRHKDTRDLIGDMDEFKIFSQAIQGEKILELSRECDFDKYYCGSTLTAERGILITPDYPALHTGPVECIWEINGMPGEIIAIDVKEFDVNNCNASRLEVRDRSNDSLIGSFCGGNKPGRLESHGNQMLIKFISSGSREGERFKVEFHRENKRTTKKTISSVCQHSELFRNMTLVGGSKAGKFTDLGEANDIQRCQERCCSKESCEVAFMIDGNCYGVRCYDQEHCLIRKAKSTHLNPVLSFIRREGLVPRIVPQFVEVNNAAKIPPLGQNENKAPPKSASAEENKVEMKECRLGEPHHNVTLVRGMKSGNFTSHGLVADFGECSNKCCQDGNCDAAFMVKRTCFSINCLDKESCRFKAARPSSFNPTLAYVIKGQGKEDHNELVHNEHDTEHSKVNVNTSGVSKSTMIESNICTKSRLSKVYRNVTLRDGINSGEFIDRGSVLNMDDCITQCCGDENCNLAFVIKDTCFTVKCKSYDACSLKSAVSRYYNPRIAYVNWSPPKDNLGVGNSKYDYKGCWKDFDMSAFAIPLLEGTDPILTGAYKKRDDPVNDCATISQHRGYSVFAIQNGGACFSGPNAESTYKRYGPSDACKGGRGGAFANSVYKLFDDGSVMSLGCWGDLQDRAFRRMEKIDDDLHDPFVNRADPIGACSKVAKKHNSKTFALQKGGQCFIGKEDENAYMRYGPSRKCKYGLGGQMANDVYLLRANNEVTGDTTMLEQGQTGKLMLRNTTDAKASPSTSDNQKAESLPTTLTPTKKTQKTSKTSETTVKATTATTAKATTSTASSTYETSEMKPNTAPTTGANTAAMQGTISQSTVAKPENTSNQRGDVLRPGEFVYKEELTDTEHIKFIYSTTGIKPNETLTVGINAGTFTDKGPIENMDDCIKSCGQTSNCDVAFKLGKQCFGVACYSPDTCHTKPAFSSYYSPVIALINHRTIKTLRNQEEKLLNKNPTQRSLCKAKNKVENVTLVDGIGSGNFTDLGHVSDMNDCISRCCSDSTCELAFRIEDDCYGVTCYSEHSCRTRSARNAMSLKPMIAFIRDIGSRQVLTQQPKAKSNDKAMAKGGNKTSKCTPDLWEGEVRHNMTLVGGISAGDFTDHGQTDTIQECMGYCCENKDCDLAFMIDKDCYGVKCKDPSMCRTRPARPTKYRPIIAFKKSSESANNNESPNISNMEQLLTIKTNKLIGNGKRVSASNSKARAGYVKPDDGTKARAGPVKSDDGFGILVKPVTSIAKAMFKDRTTVDDNADDSTFAERSYYLPLTTNSPNEITTKTTPKTTMTVIPRPPGTTPGFSSTLVRSSSSATPTFADPSNKHSCEAGSIAYNATLKMGMHSGLFTKLGRVEKMDDCIERCCKSSNADVAFMLGSVCFAVKCYSTELCKIAPAMISNIGNLNMNPTLSFLRKKPSGLLAGSDNNDIDAIIDEITDKTDDKETNQVSHNDHKDMLDKLQNISTNWEVHDRVRPNPLKPVDESSQKSCSDNPITYNVTLKGGIHAGNFTNQGEGLSDRECINKCCEKKSCDLAFMFADLCYSVDCKNEEDCQAVVAKPSSLNPKVSFVSRSRPAFDRGIMFDLSTSTNEDEEICDEAKMKHSPVMSNKTLAGGLNAGNFTYLGRTSNMKECLGKCCGSKKCDVAYRIDRDCFSVKCFSPELCKVSEAPAKNGFVQIATLTPVDKIRLNTGSVVVYVMLGSVIFTVLISGIGMALCSWRKRKKMKSQHQQTDDTPLPDR